MTRQTAFHNALRDAGRPVPPGLLDRWGNSAGKRFDVYRNNVTLSLIEALRDGFPATAALLGEANFWAIARGFVVDHAPKSPLMFLYGDEFSGYLAGVRPLAHLGYLPDVAALEWQMRLAYHAADATPVTADRLTPEGLLSARFVFAPAVRLMRSDWPVAAIRAYALGDGPAPTGGAQSVLITRPEYDPVLTVLAEPQAALLEALISGQTLANALQPDADLPELLTLILQHNALISLTPEDE